MIDPLFDLPPNAALALAAALEVGILRAPYTWTAVARAVRRDDLVDGAMASLVALDTVGASGRSTGVWLRAVVADRRRVSPPTFVWSGPRVPGLHERETAAVYVDLFQSARAELWVSTYVIVEGRTLFEPLARRMEALPNLKVTILLDVKRDGGDDRQEPAVVHSFAANFWANVWPSSTRRPLVYYFVRSLDPARGARASLHAKAVVADDARVLVTSANLTPKGVSENIEVGVVLHDPPLAATLIHHFRGLIDHGHVARLPE